jgi:hypothetical protein
MSIRSCSECGWTKLQAPSATPSPRGRWIFRGAILTCTGDRSIHVDILHDIKTGKRSRLSIKRSICKM